MAPAPKPRKFTDFMLVLSAVRYLKDPTATDLVKFIMSIYDEPRAQAKQLVKNCVHEGKTGGIFQVARSRVRMSKYLLQSSEYNSLCCTTSGQRKGGGKPLQLVKAVAARRGRPRLLETPADELRYEAIGRGAAPKKAACAKAPKKAACAKAPKMALCAKAPKKVACAKAFKMATCAKAPKKAARVNAPKITTCAKAPKKVARVKASKITTCAKATKKAARVKAPKMTACSKAPKKAEKATAKVEPPSSKGDGVVTEKKKSESKMEYVN